MEFFGIVDLDLQNLDDLADPVLNEASLGRVRRDDGEHVIVVGLVPHGGGGRHRQGRNCGSVMDLLVGIANVAKRILQLAPSELSVIRHLHHGTISSNVNRSRYSTVPSAMVKTKTFPNWID
ncbi:hypothetical protein Trco_001993 [Trichoderma cornu-damae]|uniref:Uncharacterized protein n=1 Tax=Trichoderma cornu-damae TaxID=654480 RepID=A0A9P8TY13_9HYPO|nr:hypothetical protein Trco_001993 [Trichoderma cornu-damae]